MTKASGDNRASGRDVGYPDRLLTETVRRYEDARDRPLLDDDAVTRARQGGGALETRLCRRAGSLPEAAEARSALRHVISAMRWLIFIGFIIAAAAGVAAARAALNASADGAVNVYWAIAVGLLGPQTLLLLLWMLFVLLGPSVLRNGSFGGLIVSAARALARRLHPGRMHIAATETIATHVAGGGAGRWNLSTISHALWLAFNLVALAFMIIMLSARHYTFGWETTILTDAQYTRATDIMSVGPRAIGFATPDPAQIAASQLPIIGADQAEETRHAWSQFILGSVVAYGVAPRALLLLLCLVLGARVRRRMRLDLTHPTYLRLRPRLMDTPAIGIVDADTTPGIPAPPTPGSGMPARPTSAAAIVGVELATEPSRWPPRVPGVVFSDLGFIDDRDSRRAVIAQLRGAATEPDALLIVLSMTTTPDRGIASCIASLRESVSRMPSLILSDGEGLRQRGAGDVERRVRDWRDLGRQCGIDDDHIIDLDLHHLTDASVQRLLVLLGRSDMVGQPRRIDDAFAMLMREVDGWNGPPSDGDRAQLHRAIAGIYRDSHERWSDLLLAPRELGGDVRTMLERSAEQVTSLLPASLRLRPRWMAAGAAAGALGCIAAATLLAPAAITALPIWTAAGAAVTALLAPIRRAGSADSDPELFDEAVRAGALFAVLLELQGHPQPMITRVIERTFAEEDEAVIGDRAAAARWLSAVGHQLDTALARERDA